MNKIYLIFLLMILISCTNEKISYQEDSAIIAGLEVGVDTTKKIEPEITGDVNENSQVLVEDKHKLITWWDLLSDIESDYYKEINAGYEADPSYTPPSDPPEPGINPDIDGQKVAIPGFIVGVDSDPDNFTMVNSFLFVPYQGACIHVPPPPTNQTIFVTVDEPFMSNPYAPYILFGTIYSKEGNNDLAAYSYTIIGDSLEIYE